MKKLFVAALAALAIVACSKDDSNNTNTGGETNVVEGLPTTMSIKVSTSNLGTYAPTLPTETPETGEDVMTGDIDVFVFNSSNVLEAVKTYSVAGDLVAGKTPAFAITTGLKYVYVLANKPATFGTLPAVGASRTSFEQKLMTLATANPNASEYAQTNNFYMVNLSAPVAAAVSSPGPTNITVKIGRVVAKIKGQYNVPGSLVKDVNNNVLGTISTALASDIQFKLGSYPKNTYNVGQMNATLYEAYRHAFNYATQALIDADFAKEANYRDLTVSTTNYSAPAFVLENTRSLPLEGNSTRMIVKAKFIPDANLIKAATDGTTPTSLNANGDFWVVRDASGNVGLFTEADPTGQPWLATSYPGGTVSAKYDNGVSYYNKVWIKTSETGTATEKYSVYRNHSYKVKITSVTGLGTAGEDDDITPIGPIEQESQMTAEIEVLNWSPVEQETGMQGQ